LTREQVGEQIEELERGCQTTHVVVGIGLDADAVADDPVESPQFPKSVPGIEDARPRVERGSSPSAAAGGRLCE
jgi:hypothetical protein